MERRSWLVAAALIAAVVSVGRAEMKGHWGERMGLTKDQSEKLEAAFATEKKAATPLRREMRDAMIKLHDQVEDDADDAALKATMDRVRKAKQALDAEHERFHAKLAEVLPPKPLAKLMLAHHAVMRGGMHGMMMGGMGHPPMGMMGHHMGGHHGGGPGMHEGKDKDFDEKDKDGDDEEEGGE